MKKERYFRDELQKLFFGYAIIPAVIFTLVCGLVFMAALVNGKLGSCLKDNGFAAGELERVLSGYEQELEDMALGMELPEGFTDMESRVGIFEDFYEISNRLGYEANLFVLDRDGAVAFSSREDVPVYLDPFQGKNWGIFGSMNRASGGNAARLMEAWKGQDRDIALGRTLMRGTEIMGYLVFTINSSQFKQAADRSDTQIIITDRFGWVYLSSNYNFVDSSNQILRAVSRSGRLMNYKNSLYLTAAAEVHHGQFLVYSISDIQNIVASLGLGSALVITALILMTVWVLFSTKKVTEKKTADFYRILDVLEKAGDGDLKSTIQIESDNEFSTIAHACNDMIASLKRQMENNRRMTELVSISQNKQLESQFNPHFLYNTLENIRYMCRIEPETAGKMIFSLSSLLRYSLDGNKTEVTLSEDLEHLEHYLTILKYRFNRRFNYQIDVEPAAFTCRMPKLVLQPMIENSVKYGFAREENLRVELKAYIQEGKLVMICRDNGAGITPSVLNELTALLARKENRSRHSGLYNIHRRIEILYGCPYGVEIHSAKGRGTTLVVTLPVHREDAEC